MKLFYKLTFILLFLYSCSSKKDQEKEPKQLSDAELKVKAKELAHKFLIIDTHVDVPYRLIEKMEDISGSTPGGHFDYPRAKEGGLDAPFMSIYVPASYQKGGAKKKADELIDLVEKFQNDWPDKFAVAHSVADVKAQFQKGLISLPMGIENGAPIEGKLENLKHFYERGVRYITLTHSKVNHICDSSMDETKKWNGLSPFGKEVVAEMNRLGMMVDISHVSDSTFYQVLNLTKAPLIASHSSCRKFTPRWERNMSDDMIKKLAANGGVVQINFGTPFVNGPFLKKITEIIDELSEKKIDPFGEEGTKYMDKKMKESKLGSVDVKEIADHIDHVVKLVGIDYVGLGSDYDGIPWLPEGAKDVSTYPNVIFHLLKRGYSEQDIEKICSGNILRVWSEVEKRAQELQTGS